MAFSASSCLFCVDFRGIRPCNQATAVAGITHQSSRMSFLPTSVSPRVELLLLTGFIIFTVGDFDDCCPCFPSFNKKMPPNIIQFFCAPKKKICSFPKRTLVVGGCLRRRNTNQTFPQIQNRRFIAAASGDWFVGISSKPICISTVRISVFTYSIFFEKSDQKKTLTISSGKLFLALKM